MRPGPQDIHFLPPVLRAAGKFMFDYRLHSRPWSGSRDFSSRLSAPCLPLALMGRITHGASGGLSVCQVHLLTPWVAAPGRGEGHGFCIFLSFLGLRAMFESLGLVNRSSLSFFHGTWSGTVSYEQPVGSWIESWVYNQ